ncbi:MAG: 3-oxoacyl-ACP synthase III family protein [Steroidobacteraceae bacterium]
MAFSAVRAIVNSGASLTGVDLVIGASYTPLDTIGTLAHVIQREYALVNAKALYLSTACSSFLDALEIASLYLEAGKCKKALIVAADHNSAYAHDEDISSGHLWGDGASAVLLAHEPANAQFEIQDVETQGLGEVGQGPSAVMLTHPAGITMPHGREVFMHACVNMAAAVRRLVLRNHLQLADVALIVPHQANGRIISHVAKDLEVPIERFALTIEELGNTGCASVAISLHRQIARIQAGAYVVLVTFGGGYSVGAALLRRTI